jgi:DNA-binding transcriptional MerR regulator
MVPEIPNRSLFKAPEVCEIAQVQPYVLRSWEAEFPDLGVAKSAGAPRVYRRGDLERVLRLKHLLFVEGLTLAGARRKLEEEGLRSPTSAERPGIEELLSRDARERVVQVRQGLRSLLDLLSAQRAGAPAVEFALRQEKLPPARGNGTAGRNGGVPRKTARRK